MNAPFRFQDTNVVRWQRRGVERLCQALRQVQQLLAVHPPTQALALIPIRAAPPRPSRQRQLRAWRG
jgi:hypothetical protein